MWDFSLGRAIGLMGRTWPFVCLRLAVYLSIASIYIVVTGAGSGIGYLLGGGGGTDLAYQTAWWGAVVGFGLLTAGLHFTREYVLYPVKVAHLAALVRLLDGQPIRDGKAQISDALDAVRDRFPETCALLAVDQVVKRVLRTFNEAALTAKSRIPVSPLQPAVRFVHGAIAQSLTHVDATLSAYIVRAGQGHSWDAARDGLVLYAQNYRHLLKNALWLAAFTWLPTLAAFVLLLAPVSTLVAWMPSGAGFWGFAIAIVTTWGIKSAVIDPVAAACMIQVYSKITAGQSPSWTWVQKLNALSGAFRDLGEKTGDFTDSGSSLANEASARQS